MRSLGPGHALVLPVHESAKLVNNVAPFYTFDAVNPFRKRPDDLFGVKEIDNEASRVLRSGDCAMPCSSGCH